MGKHASGDALMLKCTETGEFSTISPGILPHPCQHSLHLQSERSEITLILKMPAYPYITVVMSHPSGTVATVMTDIKRSKTSRDKSRRRNQGILESMLLGIWQSAFQGIKHTTRVCPESSSLR